MSKELRDHLSLNPGAKNSPKFKIWAYECPCMLSGFLENAVCMGEHLIPFKCNFQCYLMWQITHIFDLAINRKYFLAFLLLFNPQSAFSHTKQPLLDLHPLFTTQGQSFQWNWNGKKHRSYISYVIVDNVRTLDKGMEDSQISPGSMGTAKMVFSLRNLTRSR